MSTEYARGVMDKCAEYGIDPEMLVKQAIKIKPKIKKVNYSRLSKEELIRLNKSKDRKINKTNKKTKAPPPEEPFYAPPKWMRTGARMAGKTLLYGGAIPAAAVGTAAGVGSLIGRPGLPYRAAFLSRESLTPEATQALDEHPEFRDKVYGVKHWLKSWRPVSATKEKAESVAKPSAYTQTDPLEEEWRTSNTDR